MVFGVAAAVLALVCATALVDTVSLDSGEQGFSYNFFWGKILFTEINHLEPFFLKQGLRSRYTYLRWWLCIDSYIVS